MYKISIVLSILCMPLVSFGMESRSDFSHVGALRELHPYFNHTEFLDTLPQQETQSSIPYNAALQPMQQLDIAFYEEMAQEMDSALDDQVLQEAAQSSSLSSALLLGVALQLPYPEARDEILDDQANNEDMEPSAIYSDSTLKSIQERYAKNNKQCPIENCSKCLRSSTRAVDHAAAMHNICLLCNPLYYADRAGIKEHFTKEHPRQEFSHKLKKETCKKCDKVFNVVSLKHHTAVCKGIKNIKYTLSELEELKRIYKTNNKQCPIKDCLTVLTRPGYAVNHVAAMHNICLLCEPPLYCDDIKDMKQHFREKHPSRNYASSGKRIACKQCGKKMVASHINKHLRQACKKRMGADASAAMSDKS